MVNETVREPSSQEAAGDDVRSWVLDKLSSPDWEMRFQTRDEAIAEMRKHVCTCCAAMMDLPRSMCGREFDLYCDGGKHKRPLTVQRPSSNAGAKDEK